MFKNVSLQEQSAALFVLMEMLPGAVFMAHDPECKRITGNKRAYELVGLPPGNNISQSADSNEQPPYRTYRNGQLIAPEDLPMQRALATGQPVWDQEDHLHFPDGTERVLSINCMPLFDEQGHVKGGIATCLDITERQKLMRELEASRNELSQYATRLEERVEERTVQLQDLVHELESFSYTVSHDLRAPLRAIQGYAEIISEDFPGQIPEEALGFLAKIKRSATRLDSLVRDVLAYSRVAHNEMELVTVDLKELITEIIESYPEFQAQTAAISLHLGDQKVRANEAALTQCLSNLLYNALKFRAQDRKPALEIQTETRPGNWVRMAVTDNGIGIDPTHKDRIFALFGRVYAEELYPGTGIGLAIVKRSVERMGGQVGVESELGVGSTFWIDLPMA